MSKKKKTVTLYPTVAGTLKPFHIHGSWVVRKISLLKDSDTMGLTIHKSRFDIDFDGAKHFLRKTSADVLWNENAGDRIDLRELAASDVDRNQNIVLKATIKLNGQDHELSLGSDYSGATLKAELVPVDSLVPGGGGTGTAGRGG